MTLGSFLLCGVLAVLCACVGASSVETKQVTCGSLVKLRHVATRYRLHSHDIPYGQGSGQQSVTAFPRPDDANSYWILRGTEEVPCQQGTPIEKEQKIRLQHNLTRRWLHSHLHYSPLSHNQEVKSPCRPEIHLSRDLQVSAFGDDGMTDTGDVWIVDWDNKASEWDSSMQIYLRHVDTDTYLMSHQMRYSNPIPGQQEVCAVQSKDKKTLWETAEGVYFTLPKPPVKDEL